ncbi:MAG: hypothetical protein WC871_02210 [Bacteroidales bacterium]|jgi:hypothetical protein
MKNPTPKIELATQILTAIISIVVFMLLWRAIDSPKTPKADNTYKHDCEQSFSHMFCLCTYNQLFVYADEPADPGIFAELENDEAEPSAQMVEAIVNCREYL